VVSGRMRGNRERTPLNREKGVQGGGVGGGGGGQEGSERREKKYCFRPKPPRVDDTTKKETDATSASENGDLG